MLGALVLAAVVVVLATAITGSDLPKATVGAGGGTASSSPETPRPSPDSQIRESRVNQAIERGRAGRHRRHQAAARASAERFAAGREGRVAFAVVDPGGVVRGSDEHELFQSASVVKSMILAAELERLDREGSPLDPATRATLEQMITFSDNDAATQMFDRVGAEGIDAVGHRVGMEDLQTSVIWGATRISAADMALMFSDLDRIMPARFERFGKGLLGSVTPEQSWGIPAVARELGWNVRFKGGWRPDPSGQVVNQAAELDRNGTTIAMAVLTDQGPSMEYGIETVEGVASRLLGGG